MLPADMLPTDEASLLGMHGPGGPRGAPSPSGADVATSVLPGAAAAARETRSFSK